MTDGALPRDANTLFTVLERVVKEWRESNRKTTTAGVKSAMQLELPGFDEREYGFVDFRALVQAAEDAGVVRLHRLANGHTYVLLPDEPSVVDPLPPLPSADRDRAVRSDFEQGLRLRGDVWVALVDWMPNHLRMWDRHTRRAFMVPVDADGGPAWLVEPDRFVALPPASQHEQVDWMRRWATTQPEEVRDDLAAALSDDAPSGEFRRVLTRLGLSGAWRNELQQRVFALALHWAADNDVDVADVRDPRDAPRIRARAEHRAAEAPTPTTGHGSTASQVEELRARLHRVIDSMSFTELGAIPIRAEHLLDV